MKEPSKSHPEDFHQAKDSLSGRSTKAKTEGLWTKDYSMPQAFFNDELRTKNSKLPQASSLTPQDYKKIQNKPNFQTSQNDVSHFQKSNCLKLKANSYRKNKPKTNPIKPNLVSIRVDSWLSIFQNEPNLKISKNDVSHFSTTVYCILSPVYWKKNEPKRIQFSAMKSFQTDICQIRTIADIFCHIGIIPQKTVHT